MREASELLQQSDVTHYMERVTWRLIQEELRAHKFLHASSMPKVRLASCIMYHMLFKIVDYSRIIFLFR